ncbi:Stealth CR1 domain-containing protein [Acinetobacter colistiniresistens]|uniref:Stealth CR1 domain-containing protein n=1 Tax=Acinetobacter colistiniresistens TaxID=280145 RepID=UPI0012502AD2|nr:Stealth CR1 domain-containing protein [Acinetobacter colistiniresistens]
MMETVLPIDVVITWVDGQDSQLNQKRQKYLNTLIAKEAASQTRFASNNEIYFCIASILKYMPEVGTIYLITDQQKPLWLDEFVNQGLCSAGKIKIIDHMQLFKGYEEYLPTFNSLSIETMFWNIPELAEHFIYFNDDVFLNAPLSGSDCFEQDKVIIYGHWKSNGLIKAKYSVRKALSRWSGQELQPKFTVAQMLSAEMAGLNQYYELHHRPHFIKKKIVQEYFSQHQDTLKHQISFRFRHIEQFLPVGLANHLSIQKQQAVLKADVDVAYIKPKADVKKFIEELKNTAIQYGCVQSFDMMDDVDQVMIYQALVEKFENFLPDQIKDQMNAV